MNESLSIRPAVIDDLAFVRALDAEAFGVQAWGDLSLTEIVEGKWPTGHLLVAEADDQLLGYALLSVVLDDAELQQIAIRSDRRGQKWGATLLDNVHTWLIDREVARIVLEVRVDNLPAIGLYERAGYHRVAQRAGYYNDGTDALIYDRQLP